MIARFFVYFLTVCLVASAFLNFKQYQLGRKQQTANLILTAILTDPVVELAVDDSTGHVLVRVNYSVVKQFEGVCPPQKRL